jgi:hypothetical protein
MGLIALALSSADPHRCLSHRDAVARIRMALETSLNELPHEHGVMPHFIHSATRAVRGADSLSTVDSAWLIAGALWSAEFLKDSRLQDLAKALYGRVNWRHWATPKKGPGLLRHGRDAEGRLFPAVWDRLNGETVFMYVLAAGAAPGRALPAASWHRLRPFYGSAAGLRFNNADLGLFVFQYGLDMLDLENWRAPRGVDLWNEARLATMANRLTCQRAGRHFATYRRFWGLSAGDGPGLHRNSDTYRCYSPAESLDGTAHLTAALASVAHAPEEVLANVRLAERLRSLRPRGRYGFSNVNLDCNWVARDMIGIDAGAAVLALDNWLMNGRVREVFHKLSCVELGLERFGFECKGRPRVARRQAS